MGAFDRVILTLYTFILTFLSFGTVLVALGWRVPLDYFEMGATSQNGRLALGLLGALFLIASIRLLYFGFHRYPGEATVHETPLGEVKVSLDAIEGLVRKVVNQVKGVREARAGVSNSPNGVRVRVRASVSSDVSIPQLSDEIQNTVKNHVRSVVGIGVYEVKVYVNSIGEEHRRPRVE